MKDPRSDVLVMEVRLAASYHERLRGLLFTAPDDLVADALVLIPCFAVHTWMMRFPIDLAFLDADGIVLKALCGVKPWTSLIECRGAMAVMERPYGRATHWPLPGQRVIFSLTRGRRADPAQSEEEDQ